MAELGNGHGSGNRFKLSGVYADMNTAPCASLLLIFCAVIVSFGGPRGFPALVVDPDWHPNYTDCNMGIVVLRIGPNQSLQINGEPPIGSTELAGRLKAIFQTRAERLLFIHADQRTTYGDVIRAIDQCNGAIPNLYVSLVTPSIIGAECWRVHAPASRF